jgi:hypothetical protein
LSDPPQLKANSSHRAGWHIDELPQEDAGASLICNFGEFKRVLIHDLDLPYNER